MPIAEVYYGQFFGRDLIVPDICSYFIDGGKWMGIKGIENDIGTNTVFRSEVKVKEDSTFDMRRSTQTQPRAACLMCMYLCYS